MQRYLDSYFDLFWDLHLGVKGDEIPEGVGQIGYSFNAMVDRLGGLRQEAEFARYKNAAEYL